MVFENITHNFDLGLKGCIVLLGSCAMPQSRADFCNQNRTLFKIIHEGMNFLFSNIFEIVYILGAVWTTVDCLVGNWINFVLLKMLYKSSMSCHQNSFKFQLFKFCRFIYFRYHCTARMVWKKIIENWK